MKAKAESIFDEMIKGCFHEKLKPLGFKKKASNFYLKLDDIGQIINIQKSSYGSKTDISFTINTGIFIPEYFLAYYTFASEVPDYPIEPACAIRQRIGQLRSENDLWYTINDKTNQHSLMNQMHENLNHYILPYFSKIATREQVVSALDTLKIIVPPLGKLMIYGELKEFELAKKEYEAIIKSTRNIRILNDAKELMVKYRL